MHDAKLPRSPSRLQAVVSALGVGVLVVGVPLWLVTAVGWPWPRRLPTASQFDLVIHSPLSSAVVVDVLAAVAWVLWVWFVVGLALSMASLLGRRRRGLALPGGVMTWLAGGLLACVALRPTLPSVTTAASIPVAELAVAVPATQSASSQAAAGEAPTVHVVAPHDTLASIATAHGLGADGWRQILAANAGRLQPDGHVVSATSVLLRPGWELVVPRRATTDAVAEVVVRPGDSLWSIAQAHYGNGEQWHRIFAANAGRAQPGGARLEDPNLIDPGWTLELPDLSVVSPAPPPSVGPATPTATVAPTVVAPHAAPPGDAVHAVGNVLQRQDVERAVGPRRHGASVDAQAPGRRGDLSAQTADEVLGGLGLVAASLVATGLLRRRRRARRLAGPGDAAPPTPRGLVALEAGLARLCRLPAPQMLEAALAVLAASETPPGAVELLRVSDAAVEVMLGEPAPAPAPMCSEEDGRLWRLRAADVDGVDVGGAGRWCDLLVPVGEDETGALVVVVLRPGQLVAVVGPDAQSQVAAMEAVVDTWAWVSNRPGRSLRFAASESEVPAAAEAVVVARPSAPAGASVVVSAHDTPGQVVVAPWQITLRAVAVSPAAAEALGTLAAAADMAPVAASRDVAVAAPSPDPARIVEPAPGVEVRLLTSCLRVEGLDRVRGRELELCAYLALSPAGATSVQVAADLYGESASRETARNLASALRRSLGEAEEAGAVLSSGPRWHLEGMGCDVLRFQRAVEAATTAEDLVGALEVIDVADGQQIAPICWEWWAPAGWDARLEESAVAAGCRLAALIVDGGGDIKSARRALRRARLVAPWSESLWLAGLELAGTAGDRRWAQREWDGLRTMLHDLGDMAPSAQAEALYQAAMTQTRPADGVASDTEVSAQTQALLSMS